MVFGEVEGLNIDILDVMRSIRCLKLSQVNTVLELNFKTMKKASQRAIQLNLTHCVVRSRLATTSMRETTSRDVILFTELYHVVNRVATKFLHLSYGMLSNSFLGSTMITSCVRE